ASQVHEGFGFSASILRWVSIDTPFARADRNVAGFSPLRAISATRVARDRAVSRAVHVDLAGDSGPEVEAGALVVQLRPHRPAHAARPHAQLEAGDPSVGDVVGLRARVLLALGNGLRHLGPVGECLRHGRLRDVACHPCLRRPERGYTGGPKRDLAPALYPPKLGANWGQDSGGRPPKSTRGRQAYTSAVFQG